MLVEWLVWPHNDTDHDSHSLGDITHNRLSCYPLTSLSTHLADNLSKQPYLTTDRQISLCGVNNAKSR